MLSDPGGPEALVLRSWPDPETRDGQVLIRVRAFGLNRAEHFTRRGQSPSVVLPRVIGIECVGEVIAAPGTDLVPSPRVAAMMGGTGRACDGSDAAQTLVPADHVFPLVTDLDRATLAAIPELRQTTLGSLEVGLEIPAGQTLLVRGGTSSVGPAGRSARQASWGERGRCRASSRWSTSPPGCG